MLVPQDCGLYQEYVQVRTDLALQPNQLIKIQTEGQSCQNFGIHSQFRFLKELYDKEQAAFVSNVGNLVEPVPDRFALRGKRRCVGQFSHSNQQNGAQTLKCQDMGTMAKGAGGRVADALAVGSEQYHVTTFCIACNAIWPNGFDTERHIVGETKTGGFHKYEQHRMTIGNITAQRHGNAYAEAYARAFLEAIQTTESQGRYFGDADLATDYPMNTGLSRQLSQVARLIRARDGRGAERDLFFVTYGGWDMHSNLASGLNRRFREIDDALRAFVAEMEAQQIWDSVVLATESEFARTLDSNGGGSDHAWAGNHFVISGALKGKRVFNKFPASLREGNAQDLGRGRLIPGYPWESMIVPIAEWMGLEQDHYGEAFPNIHYFNMSEYIIPKDSLFKN